MLPNAVCISTCRKALQVFGLTTILFATVACDPAGHAQTQQAGASAAAATPEFEVATIKLTKEPNPGRMQDRTDGRRYSTRYTTLRDLIMMAYGLDPRQIVGGPAWVATDEYDIDAVAADGLPAAGNWDAMLQKLLVDRFRLTFHHEQREMSVYELTVAKGGPKLTAAAAAEGHGSGCDHLGICKFRAEPTAHFARWLQLVMDKPVVDKTGIAGEFDFTLTWTPDESQFTSMGIHVPPPVDSPNAPPGLLTALQEQLGLKLEPQKVAAEVLVIDQVERPSEN
jgi:uncharacterized protein (TIGR03435 family)